MVCFVPFIILPHPMELNTAADNAHSAIDFENMTFPLWPSGLP